MSGLLTVQSPGVWESSTCLGLLTKLPKGRNCNAPLVNLGRYYVTCGRLRLIARIDMMSFSIQWKRSLCLCWRRQYGRVIPSAKNVWISDTLRYGVMSCRKFDKGSTQSVTLARSSPVRNQQEETCSFSTKLNVQESNALTRRTILSLMSSSLFAAAAATSSCAGAKPMLPMMEEPDLPRYFILRQLPVILKKKPVQQFSFCVHCLLSLYRVYVGFMCC